MNESSSIRLQEEIIQSIGGVLQKAHDLNTFKNNLCRYLHTLINEDFEKLIFILYRLDISERKIKESLLDTQKDAGLILADLIIERQFQKMVSRQKYKQQDHDIPDDEKW